MIWNTGKNQKLKNSEFIGILFINPIINMADMTTK